MGVTLLNDHGGEITVSWRSWLNALDLADACGWEPLGTTLPDGVEDGEEWEGGYDSNDGQRVAADDARGIADALERALPSIPGGDGRASPFVPGGVVGLVNPEAAFDAVAWFSGEEKEWLRRIITHLKQGGFAIYL